jgi:hypothetical protein
MASKNNIEKSLQSSISSNTQTRKKEQEAKAPDKPTNRPQGLTIVGIGSIAWVAAYRLNHGQTLIAPS